MEIIGEDGSKITLRPNSKIVFGRGSGFSTSDRTVSRRHVVFSLEDSDGTPEEPRACFEVIGRNPIWVRTGMSGKVKTFRRSEKGEVGVGDWVCVGCQRPFWFAVKRNELEVEEKKEKETMMEDVESSELDFERVDVANIDPVKEFGFLVTGHEFDQYPKQRIRDINDWDWFLEEPRQDSDDDEDVSDKRKKRGVRRKRGKAKGKDEDEDEDDWTGESEEDKEVITKVKKVQRPAYSTRSMDRNKPQKGNQNSRSLVKKKAPPAKQDESEDEDDPTLGGFIVDDDNEEAEQESDVDEDEEEEFADDDLDDE